MNEITVTDIEKQIKPLSQNSFVRFFQKAWRGWLSKWYGFAEKHEKLSKLIYQVVFFFVFSMGVTIFQYIVTLFLPMAFGLELAGKEFLWPKLPMYKINGVQQYWSVLGYAVVYNKAGEVIIGGGMGYFIAFEIATFLAQCINFPLQRNITYRSHGNPWWQAMWYFIGWVLTSLFCNAINSLWLPFGAAYLPFALYNILSMFSMGGISMVIFFFIFMIIFPDNNVAEKRAKAKLEKLRASGAEEEKIEKAEAAYKEAARKAKLYNTEKEEAKAVSQASAKAMKYFAIVKAEEKAKGTPEAETYKQKTEAALKEAIEAIKAKDEAISARKTALEEAV